MKSNLAIALALGLLAAACASSSTESSLTPPVRACSDMADAKARAFDRCHTMPYIQARAEFVRGCETTTVVRDEAGMRGECLPWLDAASCADLTTKPMPNSCGYQFTQSNDAGPPSCKGVAGTCFTRAPSSCITQRGCTLDENRQCQGEPMPCEDIEGALACTAQFGCGWR
jgi:rubredoxin